MTKFLDSEGIRTYITGGRNPLGTNHQVRVFGWENAAVFIEGMIPYVVEKRPRLEICLMAIGLHRECVRQGPRVQNSRWRDFDILRHQLHALAVKGPKTLVPWNPV